MAAIDTALLDLIEHPVFILEPGADGLPRYAAFNDCACRVLKKPVTEVLGLTAAELCAGRLGSIAFDHHCEVLRSGRPRVYEILLPTPGTQILVRTTLRPVHDDAGQLLRIVGSSEDISGKQLFRQIQTEIGTITGEMEDFINLAAHDLRTPMRHVTQVAKMLREDFQDMGDGKLELIDLLEQLGEKAMGLIGDVLAHAQATSAMEQVVEFGFGDLVQEVLLLLDPMGHSVVEHDCGLVRGDRTATQIILRNLIENALKYSKPDGANGQTDGQLHLTVRLVDPGDGFFGVSVQDNGDGFSDPALLFLDGGKLQVDSGFGLLGIRRLIHARGGTLTVSNRSDAQGCEVAFSLPGAIEPATPEVSQNLEATARCP